MPHVVLYSTEFDVCLRGAEEAAELYRRFCDSQCHLQVLLMTLNKCCRNGTLLEFGVLAGWPQGTCFTHFGLQRVDVWYDGVISIYSSVSNEYAMSMHQIQLNQVWHLQTK